MSLNANESKKVEAKIEYLVDTVLEKFTKCLESFEGSLEDVVDRNIHGARFISSHGRFIGNDDLFDFAMDSGIVENKLVEALTRPIQPSNMLTLIAIRRAMNRNQQFDDWVRSIIEGTKVCSRIKVATGKCAHDDYDAQQGSELEKELID